MGSLIAEGNLTLTLEALASSGIVLPTEQRAALQLSLPLKKQQAGLATLQLWGRVLSDNGRDYLVAQGTSKPPYLHEKKYHFAPRSYYSQDGVEWLDLQPISAETYERCVVALQGGFTGDPAHVYEVQEEVEPTTPVPAQANPEADPDEPVPEPEPTPTNTFQIGELERLAALIKAVDADTGVVPMGAVVLDAYNNLVLNKLFAGLSYPDKLEAYVHILNGPSEVALSKDIQGLWSIQYDSFTTTAIIRSLVWPGYVFFYTASCNTFGALYQGNGEKNSDIAFMI